MANPKDDWVLLTILSNVPEAHTLGSALEDAGVDCLVQGQQSVGVFGHTGGLVRMKVMVSEGAIKAAQEVLADFESAAEHPESVHFICNTENAGQELKDLDNLVIDLERLTLCSMGRDQRRSTIEEQLGEPEERRAETVELRYPELGAIFGLDDAGQLRSFRAVVSDHPDYPQMDEFPGFWDPGSSLRPPSFGDLKGRFGEPTRWHEGTVFTYDWQMETLSIQAEFTPRGALLSFAVSFDRT